MSRILCVLMLVSLVGCRSNVLSPVVVPQASSEPVELLPGDDEEIVPAFTPTPEPSKEISDGIALLANHVIHVRCTVHLEEGSWTYQVFVNADDNLHTGIQGFDYIARGPGVDQFGTVVRETRPDPRQAGGLGKVTGYFTSEWVQDRQQLKMQIPLTSMQVCHEGGAVRVVFYDLKGGQFSVVDQCEMKI